MLCCAFTLASFCFTLTYAFVRVNATVNTSLVTFSQPKIVLIKMNVMINQAF